MRIWRTSSRSTTERRRRPPAWRSEPSSLPQNLRSPRNRRRLRPPPLPPRACPRGPFRRWPPTAITGASARSCRFRRRRSGNPPSARFRTALTTTLRETQATPISNTIGGQGAAAGDGVRPAQTNTTGMAAWKTLQRPSDLRWSWSGGRVWDRRSCRRRFSARGWRWCSRGGGGCPWPRSGTRARQCSGTSGHPRSWP